ncbi:MAG TPA: M12 family metallopeptidase [Kofleriaceae bacterium]|nr:M12 family metallopeptidase [Kofleriaceae bacterium]
MKHTSILFWISVASLGACADASAIDPNSNSQSPPEGPEEYTQLADPNGPHDHALPDDGTARAEWDVDPSLRTGVTRTVRVETPDGIKEISADVRADGTLVAGGDMIVGTTERSSFTSKVGLRWPNAKVRFAFDGTFKSTDGNDVATMNSMRDAFDRIAQRSPVRFEDLTGKALSGDVVVITNNPKETSSNVGRIGGSQTLNMHSGVQFGTMIHETLHATGFIHEQQRSDRASFVATHPECYGTDADPPADFNIVASTTLGSSYDYGSVMQYGSGAFCIPDSTDRDGDKDKTECGFHPGNPLRHCWTIENVDDVDCPVGVCFDRDGDGKREEIRSQRDDISAEDINSLWEMYAQALGTNEDGDHFGSEIAVGDFDGDGRNDLAVGAPGKAPGSDPHSGAVFLYKGTARGLEPWRVLTEETKAVEANGSIGDALGVDEEGDLFGSALAVGDFDGDGIDDLAVGAPGESVGGSGASAGAIYLFNGHANVRFDARFGLQPLRELDQNALGASPEQGDRFGQAIAAGDFDGDGTDDLAIGSPGEAFPGKPRSGVVYMVKGKTFAKTDTLSSQDFLQSLTDGQEFGFSLAAGNLDNHGSDDLVIGVPHFDEGSIESAGALAFYKGGASMQVWRFDTDPDGSAKAFDELGFRVVVGQLDGGGVEEIAASAPLHEGGRVYVYHVGPQQTVPTRFKTIGQGTVGSDDVRGELFGASLAIGDVDGDFGADLVIGAPRETIGAVTTRGQAWALRGIGFELISSVGPDAVEAASIGDGFGTATAIADVDGDNKTELFVAAPFRDDGSIDDPGAIYRFGVKNGTLVAKQKIWQPTDASDN